MRVASLSLLLLVGCQPSSPTQPAPEPMPKKEISPASEPQTLDGVPDDPDVDPYAPSYGPVVEREALYLVSPIAGGKKLQEGTLSFDDGESWIVSYRPIRSHLQFVDKRVKVRVRPYENSPMVQSVGGTHCDIESIELAAGETPYDPLPTDIPPPPQVRTIEDLEGRIGRWRWCHAIGNLVSLTENPEDTFWHGGEMRLTDGTTVPLVSIRKSDDAFEQLVGSEVTILGRLLGDGAEQPFRISAATICPGVVESCRMDLGNVRED